MSKEQQMIPRSKQGIRRYLPKIMLILFILQPVMDVLSYWLITLGMSTTSTLLIRTLMLVFTVLLGFAISRRKQAYILLGAILVLLAAAHAYVCTLNGYQNLFEDFSNYIRVIQLPVFTFCFITFLDCAEEEGYKAVEQGFVINFSIIAAVEVISALTGTNAYTYPNKEIGLLGWFYWENSQSAILSALVPVLLMIALRKGSTVWLAATTAASFLLLYLFATRLAYLAIFVCAIGFVLVLILCRTMERRKIAILLLAAVLFGAAYPISPMHRNQLAQQQVAREAQQQADEQIAQAELQYHTTVEKDPETCLLSVYEEHLGGMLDRFGVERVMKEYQYTSDVTQLKDWRRMKIIYCCFLMQDAGIPARLFGLEVSDMIWKNQSFDVENDFHGIYYMYGIVGLGLILLFLVYFIALTIGALFKNFHRYMTLEAGGFGISFCMMMVHIYFTASILRRNNASFYLSVVLAVIYYFVNIRKYPPKSGE